MGRDSISRAPQIPPATQARVSYCFQDANYAYTTRTEGNFKENPSMRTLAKFCEHEQASTHLIFASNSSKGQNLPALSNWIGPFDTPHKPLPSTETLISTCTCANVIYCKTCFSTDILSSDYCISSFLIG